jgi:hypothetical protein
VIFDSDNDSDGAAETTSQPPTADYILRVFVGRWLVSTWIPIVFGLVSFGLLFSRWIRSAVLLLPLRFQSQSFEASVNQKT